MPLPHATNLPTPPRRPDRPFSALPSATHRPRCATARGTTALTLGRAHGTAHGAMCSWSHAHADRLTGELALREAWAPTHARRAFRAGSAGVRDALRASPRARGLRAASARLRPPLHASTPARKRTVNEVCERVGSMDASRLLAARARGAPSFWASGRQRPGRRARRAPPSKSVGNSTQSSRAPPAQLVHKSSGHAGEAPLAYTLRRCPAPAVATPRSRVSAPQVPRREA